MAGRSARLLAAAFATVAFVFTAGCGGEGREETPRETRAAANPADFHAEVDHPFFPLSSVRLTVFEGSLRDPETKERIRAHIESRVLERTDRVAGVPVTVVQVKEWEDGELVERTLDYYAERRDGSVWYLGERVDDYQGGKIVGHEGQWLAGQGKNRPGLYLHAKLKVGQVFHQEQAPGVAEDRTTVVELGLTVRTPAGTFSDCVKTRDFAPLDQVTELKYRCPGIGVVREDQEGGRIVLVRYR